MQVVTGSVLYWTSHHWSGFLSAFNSLVYDSVATIHFHNNANSTIINKTALHVHIYVANIYGARCSCTLVLAEPYINPTIIAWSWPTHYQHRLQHTYKWIIQLICIISKIMHACIQVSMWQIAYYVATIWSLSSSWVRSGIVFVLNSQSSPNLTTYIAS